MTIPLLILCGVIVAAMLLDVTRLPLADGAILALALFATVAAFIIVARGGR